MNPPIEVLGCVFNPHGAQPCSATALVYVECTGRPERGLPHHWRPMCLEHASLYVLAAVEDALAGETQTAVRPLGWVPVETVPAA